ncbi:condensation domain-containing protein [Streptomyces sp. NPDC090083]|uniref:condensation domain-containing protein n=1 Tax=Streptomyces sp. NPDC090083 TaxID=3365941 RepID=UPI00381D7BD1
MTADRFPYAPTVLVLGPAPDPAPGPGAGSGARTVPWDLELRGPLDTAALRRLLHRPAGEGPDPAAAGGHRLLRHGPGHHTLRCTAEGDTPAAAVAGRIADLLTTTASVHPLTPAQRALLTPDGTRPHGDSHGYGCEAFFLETPAGTDAETVRRALRTVLAVHPQLRHRLDAEAGHLTGPPGPDGQDLLTEGEFTDEPGYTAAVTALYRTLDPPAGIHLRALLARDRRPDRPDRLTLLTHPLTTDPTTRDILLTDLTTALSPAAPGGPTPAAGSSPATHPSPAPATASAPVPGRRAGDGLADWVAGLREVARDPAEARHWSLVAERRSRSAFRTVAGTPRPGGTAGTAAPPGTVPPPAPGTATPGAVPYVATDSRPDSAALLPAPETPLPAAPAPLHRAGFTLDEERTERITRHLAQRLALTAEQVLTGVFALALARWQHTDEVGFDVRSDPRTAHPGLRRHAGRLTDVHPVQLTLDPGPDALGRLAAAAGFLAAGAGRAAGGAGFGACREFSPDPLLRATLRALPPAPACLILHAPHDAPPAPAHPVPGLPQPRTHHLQAHARITAGRLHFTLDRPPGTPETTGPAAPSASDDATSPPAPTAPSPPPAGPTGSPATAPPALTDLTALTALLQDVLDELADCATAPIPGVFAPTAQQAALYAGGDGEPGTGRHVEQVVWVWHGPLDAGRFGAAWQSVFDREAVLRTAFTGTIPPRLIVHGHVTPDITRRVPSGADRALFLEHDRLRGFDLRRPGALRLTLLEPEQAPPAGPGTSTRIVLTYHRALLDTWSAHLLLRTFYRAYLAGGTLPGGQRRPDLRDYTAWIAAQDPRPARALWARLTPPAVTAAASRPGSRDAAGGGSGVGRARLRLDAAETVRLARWAGTWGTAESSVLQAVWALLIYRASGATGAAPVCFAVTVPGRGIALDGAAWLPGPLRNLLPMSLDVDPAHTLPRLLRHLRDRALDMAACEWLPTDMPATDMPSTEASPTGVPSAGAGPQAGRAETVLVFEDPPHPVHGLEGELAAHGIRAEFPGTVPARSALPLALLAHHDDTGGLVLTGVHDRALLDEDAAAELLVQSALLLRELPLTADESTTVAQALALLEGRAVPSMADDTPAAPGPAAAGPCGPGGPLTLLRAARHAHAGTICLLVPPGAPPTCYDQLPPAYPGPQELLLLTGTGSGVTDTGAAALAARAAGRPLLLAGFSGAGAAACDLAHRLTTTGGGRRPPRVVLTPAPPGAHERARLLARALQDATAPPPAP